MNSVYLGVMLYGAPHQARNDRDAHSFDRTSTMPGYDRTKLITDEIVAYLNC